MPKKKKNKNKKGKKGKGGNSIELPEVDEIEETLDDYLEYEDVSTKAKKKKKTFTGFETAEDIQKNKRDVVSELSDDEDYEKKGTGKKSRAQLKKEKKAAKKKKEEEAKKKAEANKKKSSKYDDYSDYSDDSYDSYEDRPKKKGAKGKGKKGKKYDDDYSDYSDASYDSYEDRPKKSKKKTRKYSDDYSDYSDDSYEPKKKKGKKDYYSDEDDYSDSYDAPKKGKKKSRKYSDSFEDVPKKKGKKAKKYSDDYSDDYSDYSDSPKNKKKGKGKKKSKYSDDDYYSDEDSYDAPKKKGKGKKGGKRYDDYSDYSDESDFEDEKPKKKAVNKKDPTKGPSARTLKKKAAKAKKNRNKYDDLFDDEDEVKPAPKPEKRRPTMSDDESSEDYREKRKPAPKKEAPKKQSGFASLMQWSDEDEEEDDEFADLPEPVKEPEPEKEKEPEPVKIDWKKKKAEDKKKKKGKKDDIEDEFGDLFKEEPKKLSKAALKRQRQKERKAAAKAAAAMGVTPDQPKKPQTPKKKKEKKKQLSKAEQARLEKFEAEKRKREEAKLKKEQEERERIEREKEEEKQRELDRIEAEKRREERRKIQKENAKIKEQERKKQERLKKAGISSFDAQARAKEAAARREAKKNKRNRQKNKRREEEEARKREEEERKRKQEEKERLEREEAERKKREEEERAQKEAEEKAARLARIKKMEEEARRGNFKKTAAPAKEESSGDEWEDDDSEDEVNEPEDISKNSEDDAADDWEDDESDDFDDEPAKQDDTPVAAPGDDGGWDDDESDEGEAAPESKAKSVPQEYDDSEEEEVEAKVETPKAKKESAKPPEPEKESGPQIVRKRKKGKEIIDCSDKKTLKKIAEKMKDIQKATKSKIKIDAKLGKVTVSAKSDAAIDKGAEMVIKIIVKQEKKKIDMSRLRAPIGVIMGNVDAGKTKLLDYIRGTKVQDGEAGGITQQIGATNLPMSYIKEKAGEAVVASMLDEVHLPGLLVIDTPGHAAFGNLRKRGSAMCDVAIVVVNIFNGIEGTSAQCINMLKENGAPFVVALNQIDRLTGWETYPGTPIKEAIDKQGRNTRDQFQQLYKRCRAQFAAECQMNADLFWESSDLQKGKLRSDNINCIPTSAHSGDGVSDLLMLWVKLCQIRKLAKRLVLSPILRCTILEVKKVQGFGHTIDVIVSDGTLRQGDTIAVCGMKGPIVGKVKGLLTPKKMQDLRVKIVEYDNLPEVHASAGVRIAIVGDSLEDAVPGSQIELIEDPKDADEVEDKKDIVQKGLQSLLTNLKCGDEGVYIVASTLGALEALFGFVKDEIKIPVSGISVGKVKRKDVMRASVMLEKKAEFAVILAFDVDIAQDAADLAEAEGIRIMTADIIYQLQVQFQEYIDEVSSQFKDEYRDKAVFPVLMEIIPNKIFARKDPIIFGVEIIRGSLRLNTPICALDDGSSPLFIGRVSTIHGDENKELDKATRGMKVAIRIDLTNENSTKIEYKRHFSENAKLISRLSRDSIDTLKMYFADEIDRKEDAPLIRKLKPIFGIK